MIMTWVSSLFTGALSKPVLIIGIIILGHQLWEARDARLQAEGRSACNATWHVAFAKQRERNARREATRAQELMEGERKINQELSDELQKVRDEARALRAASSEPDPRCLSPGVLDALRKRAGVE